MPQGHSQTEETKKKISEALKKGGAEETSAPVQRSPEAQALFNDYTKSKQVTDALYAQREKLLASRKAMGKKKGSKEQRAKIKKQLTEIAKQVKAEKEKRKELRTQALQLKRVKMAKLYIERAKNRDTKIGAIERRANEVLAKATTPERKARIQETLNRAKQAREKSKENVAKAEKIISEKGYKAQKTGSSVFDLVDHLSEQPYNLYRALTVQEKRSDFKLLNDEFNDLQVDIERQMTEAMQFEIEAFANKVESKISAGDIAAVAALAFLLRGTLKDILNPAISRSYEVGKKLAAKELGVTPPATTIKQIKLKNLEIENIVEAIVTSLALTGKGVIESGVAADASVAAITAAVRDAMEEEASKVITNVSGTVVGKNINRGRNQVFLENISKIKMFQRSEVLDGRTCNMCLSLDKRVVKASDPIAQMDVVHSHCRGVWIPIFVSDPEQPKETGVPKTIRDSFDMIDGRPVANSFKQLKRPINKANKTVQDLVKSKLKKKK